MRLPDLNFWLALAFEVHTHHRRAAGWFAEQAVESCAFCRFTQQGFLRLATNPAVFGDEVVTMSTAWMCYDRLLADERVYYREEPSGLEAQWRAYSRRRQYSHKVWSDAYLAAFGVVDRLELITFDRGFLLYDGLKVTLLEV
jgi:uncharacterized protein